MSCKNVINACNNCGKQGHLFHQCKLPIISCGIIAFKKVSNNIQYLMIRRKDGFGYIDFIRGKYSPYNLKQMVKIFDEMNIYEKARILEKPFDILWEEMWGEVNAHFKSEEFASKKKFEMLQEGVLIADQTYTLTDIVNMSKTMWTETEWEFPKGRRNQKEKDLDCALREFEEETGISKNQLTIIENILPFEETFIASNHKSYKHKYFLALFNNKLEENLNNYQSTEVSKIEWKTIDQCLESIRPYNLEKKELIVNIDKMIHEYIYF